MTKLKIKTISEWSDSDFDVAVNNFSKDHEVRYMQTHAVKMTETKVCLVAVLMYE